MSGTERRKQNFILLFIVSESRVYSRGQHMQILLKEKEVFTEKISSPTGLVWDTNRAPIWLP